MPYRYCTQGLDRVFDAMSVRAALESRQASLEEELRRVSNLAPTRRGYWYYS